MNKFNAKLVADETKSNEAVKYYGSWTNLARYLDEAGYNGFEASAILSSEIPLNAVKEHGYSKKTENWNRHTKWHLNRHLTILNLGPGSKGVTELVMAANPDLVLNADGKACRKGTMPGNQEGGEILVEVGTPLSCDPTSDTYWSM